MQAVDPFMADVPVRRPGDFQRSKQGTPYVSHPTGQLTKPKTKADPGHVKMLPYGRPSNLGKQIEDMYSIQKWAERQVCLGFAIDGDLATLAQPLASADDYDTGEWRSAADKVVGAAKSAAKAGIAADRGTHAHELTEDDDNDRDIIARIEAGEELGLDERVQRDLVTAWRTMLERDGLEILAVEAAVVHDGYRQAGTLDRIARLTRPLRFTIHGGEIIELPAGLVLILDIKSGKRRRRDNGTAMYWQSYAVQVAVYAGALPYDTETETRGVWPFSIDQRWAVIAHLDVLGALDGNPSCDLVLVDIEAGRRAADLCLAAKAWEAEHTVFSIAQLEVEAQDVPVEEAVPVGSGRASHGALHRHSDSPDTPTVPVTAGDAVSADPTPSPAPSTEALGWAGKPAAVPPPALPADPDEGSSVHLDELFNALQVEYDTLDADARLWIKALIGQAMRHGVSFHAHNNRTERRYWLIRGLVCLGHAHLAEDEVLRALVADALDSDAPLFTAIEPGHALGACGVVEAEKFASRVDRLLAGGLVPYLDESSLLRLKPTAA